MNKIKIPLLKSFQAKVTLVLILSLLFIGALNNFLIYQYALDSQFNAIRNKLKVIAQTAALMIDADVISRIPLRKEGMNTPEYKAIVRKLEEIKKANPPIKFIYTMAPTEKKGVCRFIVDPDVPTEKEIAQGLTNYPGDEYDASRFVEMCKAFEGPAADTKLETDEWGVTLSGYAPIRDKNKKAVAILGVDMMADDVFSLQKQVHRRAVLVLGLGILLSFILGFLISKRISSPIKKLVEGTHHVAGGNLDHLVEVSGADELVELAKSFNDMSMSLSKARKRLLKYFYNIVQSLIRVMEARDPYTKGHSEKVAEYAEKIALKMGVPDEKVELLKEIALLHDIGKLGIQEKILNKKGKLTEEEWEIIRKHPIIGEDILKPVHISQEMLTIVRSHHERFDGNGYPDKLSGESINILASIVSVADAYDAMTSPRAYRPALNREKAVEELKKNSGTQFHADVVETFISIMGQTPST
ncbi:MAG: HD domain-containing protein [Candidatus Aureabacteria bacterium]|nr:HD domain-containing protein [Candidatus Auribacterota bacterium]